MADSTNIANEIERIDAACKVLDKMLSRIEISSEFHEKWKEAIEQDCSLLADTRNGFLNRESRATFEDHLRQAFKAGGPRLLQRYVGTVNTRLSNDPNSPIIIGMDPEAVPLPLAFEEDLQPGQFGEYQIIFKRSGKVIGFPF